MISEQALDDLLSSAARKQKAAWPDGWHGSDLEDAVFRRVEFHGIASHLVSNSELLVGWPDSLRARLLHQARAYAMREMAHRVVLTSLLAHFHEQGIDAIVMKGTAVAYSLYDDPALRPRGDTDLLVRAADLRKARAALQALGYSRSDVSEGPFGSLNLQETWSYQYQGGSWFDIDLHWQVCNAAALGDILPVEECFESSEPLPRLCDKARSMGGVNRLIHGCINRKSHESVGVHVIDQTVYSGDRLCWAKDLDLQAERLSIPEWSQFARKAILMGVAAICLDGLKFAQQSLGTNVPETVLSQLAAAPRLSKASTYFDNPENLTRLKLDFVGTQGVKAKCKFILARGFPSPEFMRAKYSSVPEMPVPLLYARRFFEAPLRLIRRNRR